MSSELQPMASLIKNIHAFAAVIDRDGIDTDQLAPARFLKIERKEELADALFADWSDHEIGSLAYLRRLGQQLGSFPRILAAGENFGCGSSREHAVWALQLAGIHAVVAPSFAPIFYHNAWRNQVIPVTISAAYWQKLRLRSHWQMALDLEKMQIATEGGVEPWSLEPFARYCLMRGVDEWDYLKERLERIAEYESKSASVTKK